jgi:hypothetical protein
LAWVKNYQPADHLLPPPLPLLLPLQALLLSYNKIIEKTEIK